MTSVSSPPTYRRVTNSLGLAPESTHDLPPYTRRNTLNSVVRREPTEHVYHLSEGKGNPWATLKVYSSAKSTKSLPTFFEKEPVTASLEVHAEKGDSIQQITAIVTGRLITGASSSDELTFLCETLPIWAKSPTIHRVPSHSEGASGAKLLGKCEWPISITLPKAVNIPNANGEACFYRLPETFLERHTKVSIQYDLTIYISRGKLRANSQIKTAFGFVPSTRPSPFSVPRQLAYQQGTPLPGPLDDPEGWKILRPVSARGIMFKSRKVEVRCTFSLAKPLSYTRGSVLPCRITLEGNDVATLDAFSMPSSIAVVLRRRVRWYHQTSSARQDVAWNDSVEDVGTAVWWPSGDGRTDRFTRHLEGEIRLAKDLRPTSAMGHYSLSYSVVLCPFDISNLSSDPAPLLSEPVEITTMHAKGPRPVAYSPPAYEHSSRRCNDQYFAHY
ncbi:hypothetical protein AMATHDRAFT_55616 [Amanita thiersii Skay4041]|uniref:Arrestin-like N-terminal domain-containing protein n=1 Tax=Amanita thiersii Skay4041 TaxID=703135 RepID=A0A2A9NZ42_9AGAR|nr:hypothetical protein AMATHDRAFT_55616 [Amanita thiersii Skay4041]